jgi:hypothetical protein
MGVDVYRRIFKAHLVSLFAQWGTTGAAVIIAYYTPMVGFGCRSGAYTLYGILGTAVLFFLILSMVLSHLAMKIYQKAHIDGRDNFAESDWREDQTWYHWIVCVAANLTRLVGKFLAVANSLF